MEADRHATFAAAAAAAVRAMMEAKLRFSGKIQLCANHTSRYNAFDAHRNCRRAASQNRINIFFSHGRRAICAAYRDDGIQTSKQHTSEQLRGACGTSQRIDDFRRVGQTRVAVSRAGDKVHCAACDQDLEHPVCNPDSLRNCFSNERRIICATCGDRDCNSRGSCSLLHDKSGR